MAEHTAQTLVLQEGRKMMHALSQVHMRNNGLSTRQFLRCCHMWKHGKDIEDLVLANDAKRLDEQGIVAPYAVNYLIHVYGVQ